MSPDDIFAAQFWPWPDPAVKRDAAGRVLFVNAAFLQLYGGQAQDWHGNAVGGWPAPQGPGQPYRFETRIPGQVGASDEQVYDWIEMTLADGSAFALARNVTAFVQTPDPQPGQDMTTPPVDVPAQNDAPPASAEAYAPPPPAHAPAMEASDISEPAVADEVVTEAPEAATEEIVPIFESTPVVEETPPAPAEAPVAEAPPAPEAAAPVAPAPAAFGQPVDEGRDYERRALPIETDSAVLGNNWRDAVIAKAVGAEPATTEDAAEPAPAPTIETNMLDEGPIRILLAEDNAINALLTRTLLEAEGHTVETVEDGQLAVEAMKTSTYDLIFMDMRMPNMDGLEATRKIRTLPNVAQDLPIIALTANAFDDDRNACFDSGMNDFMTKPVSAEELSEMVKTWMSPEKQKIAI